ncbi:DUF58 domain-containing protein [Flaviflexus salsibiostraticola]|uniref:DUF58 domain-containing protein n=1 Tax=Flaviflexus salsibiostraticola TaxID=1282737 RepID=A0A3S8ZC00_9ACTO|nr:DUF58 domain-containing protein [Flaviflexus salsibiostraticola]AZN30881.1 DUF58 domain-containing protein [Flaviflexus salsibiostraticola]
MFLTTRSTILAALAVPAGMIEGGWLWPAIIIAVVAILSGLDWVLAGSAANISSERPPVTMRLGTSHPSRATITNRGRRPLAGAVRHGWPPSVRVTPPTFEYALEPGASTTHSALLTPTRRGTITSGPLVIRTRGPFGLAGRQTSRYDEAQLTVLPEFRSRRYLPSRIARLREMEGRSLLLVSGEGTEFDSLRDYVRGDDVRAIDWRSSARRGQTLVKTWRPERDRRIIALLDCGRSASMRIGDEPRIDSGIETTLLLAALAERSGDRLHVLAHDDRLRVRVDPGRRQTTHALAAALADIHPSLAQTDWIGAAGAVRRTVSNRALVVITTALDSGVVPGGLLEAIPLLRRHTVLIAVAEDPTLQAMTEIDGTSASAYEAAAAHRALLEEKALAEHLARLGAHVVFATPEALPAKVADAYLDLKEAGRL